MWKRARLSYFKASLEDLKDKVYNAFTGEHSGIHGEEFDTFTDTISESRSVEDLYHVVNDIVAKDNDRTSQK